MAAPSTSIVFFASGCSDIDAKSRKPAGSAVGGHEDRKRKTGEVMQRLIDANQRPEPWMLQRHAEIRRYESLGAIDRDVDDEIDHRDEPEFRRDDQDHHQR